MADLAQVLLLRSGTRLCGVPVEHVVEICRPLATDTLGAGPDFVRGVTRLRGLAVPVLDMNRLLGGGQDTRPTRYVSLRVGERRVVLAVEEVLELKGMDRAVLAELPPMLVTAATVVEAVASLDSELLWVLGTARLFPADERV